MILFNHKCFLQSLQLEAAPEKKSLKEIAMWIIRPLGKIPFEGSAFEWLKKKYKKSILRNCLETSPSWPQPPTPEAAEC